MDSTSWNFNRDEDLPDGVTPKDSPELNVMNVWDSKRYQTTLSSDDEDDMPEGPEHLIDLQQSQRSIASKKILNRSHDAGSEIVGARKSFDSNETDAKSDVYYN